jgi:salicylate hydroxylase
MMQIRRWHDGKVLAQQPLMDMAGYIGHRGDYHEVFLSAVRDAGVEIIMGHEVVAFDESKPSVLFADGQEIEADVIVGADGIKSRARELVLGFKDHPRSSGYSCFRAYFPGSYLKDVEPCKDFTGGDSVNIWIGDDTHVVQNTLRNGEEFNWILTRKLSDEKDQEITESWFQEGDLEEVWECVDGLDERIVAAIKRTPSCLDWKICYRDPLPTWVSRSHKIVLLGDSCHPHLPTSAQGASQATESAAVLAMCLKLAGRDKVPLATRTYEKLRFVRTRQSQTNGEDLRDRWHSALRSVNEGIEIDPESVMMRNRPLYAFDAEADTMQRWHAVSCQVAEELTDGHISPLFTSKDAEVVAEVEPKLAVTA